MGRRGHEFLIGFRVGVVVLGVVTIALANIVTVPLNATVVERIVYGVAGFLAAAGITALIAYGVAFIRGPVRTTKCVAR